MAPHHDIAGVVGTASAVGFAAVPWIVNLETILRIGSYALSMAVAIATLYHLYTVHIRKKS